MQPVYLSLRWQNFLTVGIMVVAMAFAYVAVTQTYRKVTASNGS
jgi:hypothetical protein